MKIKKWIYSNEERQWSEGGLMPGAETKYSESVQEPKISSQWSENRQKPESDSQGGKSVKAFVSPNGQRYQKMNGFGGCFNEQGYAALLCLSSEEQDRLLQELFALGEEGCNLTLCRMPIGANDYSYDWYSLNETPGDYEMKNFSLERDKKSLIPYIKHAMAYQPGLKLFASPWSPPVWMKNPPVYNWGKLINTEKNLKAYALYFRRFIEEYEKENIHIQQVHVQNEPVANQKFPSCMWSGEELRDFIKDYLGPELRDNGLDTEIWLGTINAPGCDYKRLIFDKWATEDYDYYANTVLMDKAARQYITGVSYQWGGKIAIQRTYESWGKEIRLMQSENECGFGDNTWEYARYVWTMLKHYISNGAESYLYWNLILKPNGVSTWGDPQNAMVTVKPDTKGYILNPDFYVMKHFSNIVKDGAVRLGLEGTFAADTVGFLNPDGTYAFVLFNPFSEVFPVELKVAEEAGVFSLPPKSISSIVIECD